MAPTLAKQIHRPGWVYEEKYDGAFASLCPLVQRFAPRHNVPLTRS